MIMPMTHNFIYILTVFHYIYVSKRGTQLISVLESRPGRDLIVPPFQRSGPEA